MGKVQRLLVAGVAIAAVAGGSAVAWAVIDDPDDTDPGTMQTTMLTARDAEPASAGTSRKIRREVAGEVRVVGVPWRSDAEPRLVIGARSNPTSVEVVDRRTGARTSLPTPWQGHSVSVQAVRITEREVWVSWVHHVDGEERPAVLQYTVATGRQRLIVAPEVPHHPRADFSSPLQYGDDGRFYFRTARPGHDGPDKLTELWSFAPGAPDDVRPEGKAQQWTVTGSLLVSLDHGDGAPATLRVRDLTTGDEHVKDLGSCYDPYFEASDEYVVVTCRDESGLVVLDRTTAALARLEEPERVNVAGYGPPSLRVGERWITVGRLAYEPGTGRLLRLTEPPA